MDRQSRKFKIFAAIITIPLFTVLLFGYSFVIFMYADGLSDIKYYFLLGLGFIGILLWAKMSVNTVKEIKLLKV
ncbi:MULTISPECIES: hypothetical protein [Pseudoalteromonas]|uniref:Orphan protein n=1 Tax=Pseudoalteromonas translucida (strain TAC 125) TaxID=326442 RepID=Q3IGC4_PSET1|nr:MULTISPECIES: hypothetical protein [Pseudoalteromonas]MBH0093316.1 hypothetical protein [Pseudoalteromonas sp. SCQQ13]CAI86537.1 putative orphan protein [Pseudoalteromonas translucida]